MNTLTTKLAEQLAKSSELEDTIRKNLKSIGYMSSSSILGLQHEDQISYAVCRELIWTHYHLIENLQGNWRNGPFRNCLIGKRASKLLA